MGSHQRRAGNLEAQHLLVLETRHEVSDVGCSRSAGSEFTAERRNISTVPTQALMLLNDEFVLLQSRFLAERVMHEAGSDPPAEVKLLYKIALSRPPTEKELRDDLEFVNREGAQAAQARPEEDTHLGVMSRLAHVMLNSNEFVYIN
jgi:hypothetical protein